MSEQRCPKCNSSNVVGYKGVWECFNCGYSFRTSRTFKPILKFVTILITIAAALSFVYAALVTNVLGPIEVRVVQTTTTTQFATLSLVSTPPSEIPAGSDLELTVRLNVNTAFSNGILVVEVKATDFNPTSSDVSAKYYRGNILCGTSHGWTDMAAQNAVDGVHFLGTTFKFTCSAGESGNISIKLTLRTPNPTPDGKYLIKAWIETT
jgi:hypothetical protein